MMDGQHSCGTLRQGVQAMACGPKRSRQGQISRRFLISSADSPATRITLFRLVWPAAIVTDERGTFKSFAKNSMQASLALPSTGGAVSATLRASPIWPVIAFFFARGWTLTAKLTPVGEFLITTIERLYHRGHGGHGGNPANKSIRVSSVFSVTSVVMLLLSPRKSPFPRARTSILLQSPLRSHATCQSKAHPFRPPANAAMRSDHEFPAVAGRKAERPPDFPNRAGRSSGREPSDFPSAVRPAELAPTPLTLERPRSSHPRRRR